MMSIKIDNRLQFYIVTGGWGGNSTGLFSSGISRCCNDCCGIVLEVFPTVVSGPYFELLQEDILRLHLLQFIYSFLDYSGVGERSASINHS